MKHLNDWHWEDQDTVPAAFARAVAAGPERIFLDFSGDLYSYGEFDRLTTRFAHALDGLGVRAGDTVLTMLDNNIDAMTAWFAINKIAGHRRARQHGVARRVPAPPVERFRGLDRRLRSGLPATDRRSRRSSDGGQADPLPRARRAPSRLVRSRSHRSTTIGVSTRRRSSSSPDPPTSRASSTRRGRRGRRKAACRATTTSATLRRLA